MKNREKAEKAKEPKKLIDGHAQITRKSDNQDKVSMPYKSNEKEKKGEPKKSKKKKRKEKRKTTQRVELLIVILSL
jgi:hypothetical protein